MFEYLFLQIIGFVLVVVAIVLFIKHETHRGAVWHFFKKAWVAILVLILGSTLYVYGERTHAPSFALPPWMQSFDPHHKKPFIPFANISQFFTQYSDFTRVGDIGADPNDVPPPLNRWENKTVKIAMTAQEVVSEVAPEVFFNFWTYDQQVPGPMLRVVEGDTVELTLTNHESSLHPHNIDLHAVTGPGGGASLSLVEPGETKTFRWKALAPGLYIYHCATANVSTHNAHGQYGLILVEPRGGLPPVDKEFYVVQGEIYTKGALGKKGLVAFDAEALLAADANYVTFNGKVEELPRMKVNVGDTVRIFVGNGGVNYISSFHPIGEIFDIVYDEGGIGAEPLQNIQTTAVLPGGASIVEFTADVPGNLILVDHALARMNKGAWAVIEVAGDEQPDIYSAVE